MNYAYLDALNEYAQEWTDAIERLQYLSREANIHPALREPVFQDLHDWLDIALNRDNLKEIINGRKTGNQHK